MEHNVKTHLLEAIRFMMKPLVRLLINQGVTHSEFSEAMKDVYVDVAVRHFDDGKVNQSRVAILTGLSRKEVRNVIQRATTEQQEIKSKSRPERVLTGWHQDPQYQGPYGLPKDLVYEHEDPKMPSFSRLVKSFSGDMSPSQMLEELMRGGSVIKMEGEGEPLYKVVRRDFEPTALSRKLISRLGEVGHYVFVTAAANIEKEEQGSGHFDRFAFADDGCDEQVVDLLDQFMKVKGQEFLEDVDRWISTHNPMNDDGEDRMETGVYVCQYVADPKERGTLADLLSERGIDLGSEK